MKKPFAVYKTNKYIDKNTNEVFTILERYYDYYTEFDYTIKAKETILQLNEELATDSELIQILENNNFKKEN